MKILVTGSEGFIGSHLVEKLIKKGFKVRAFTQYHFQNNLGCLEDIEKKVFKKIEIVSGDIRDPFEMNLATKNCDYVINLAALIGIPYSFIAPKNYFDTNVIGTMNVLEASKKNNIKKIILTSTSEVYGTAQTVPIKENHPLNAQSPYAASKISSDFLGMSYFHTYNLPITILRPFNTFGPRQSGRAIIPSILIQALENKKTIELGNLNPTRDFNYVSDTTEAFLKTLITKSNLNGEIFNVSSGYEISIGEVCYLIKKITGKEFNVVQNKNRTRSKSTEVERLLGDNKKIIKHLKWKPKYYKKQGFINGLKKTIEWFESNENLSKYKKIYNL